MKVNLSSQTVEICQHLWLSSGGAQVSPEEMCRQIIEALAQQLRFEIGESELFNAIEDEEEVAPEPIPINLSEVEHLGREEIMKEAPKDCLAELCGDDQEAWLALGITYKAIPQSQWGGPVAERLFLKTLETIRRQA